MATYNLSELINKTIRAKSNVQLYRSANDNANPYATIKSGQPVGVLYSYINPSGNTKSLWFMFYDGNNKPYYAKYLQGSVDESNLKAQGVVSTEQKTKEASDMAKKESDGLFQFYIEKYVPYIIAGLFLIPLIKEKIK